MSKRKMLQASGFQKLKEYYEENKNRPWQEWLKVDRIFPRPGKQGLVGTMKSLDEKDDITYVFKMSQSINYLTNHESAVMRGLNELGDFCPHFCKVVGEITCNVDPMKNKAGNPFECKGKYQIEKDVMLMEYLPKSYKLRNYITSPKVSEEKLFSALRQVLMATSIAASKKKFAHYDLHSNNVMMRKCSKDLVFLYVLDDQNQFCVPTFGSFATIIDFGFSYIGDMKDQPLWQSLNHTDVGFMSDRFDEVADPKLFLVTVSDELKTFKRSSNTKTLFRLVKELYKPLEIDWDSGWDNDTKDCANDSVSDALKGVHRISKTFYDYEYFCLDLIQTLITQPLQGQVKQPLRQETRATELQKSLKMKQGDLKTAAFAFLSEFAKFETVLSSKFFLLYILKCVVDAARQIKKDYYRKETRQQAVEYFRFAILERLDSIAAFCRPKDVHYEKMLCGLLCFVKAEEGILCDVISNRMKVKEQMYENLALRKPEEVCALIDLHIQHRYTFSEKTVVMVIDCRDETSYTLSLNSEQIMRMNDTEVVMQGSELFRIINNFSESKSPNESIRDLESSVDEAERYSVEQLLSLSGDAGQSEL